MFSTMYTVVDGYTRICIEVLKNSAPDSNIVKNEQKLYLPISVILCVGAVVVLATMMKSFTTFMDLVSIIVFVTSPLIAVLNHKAVFGKTMPEEEKPCTLMKIWSYVGIAFLTLCTLTYIYIKFVQ